MMSTLMSLKPLVVCSQSLIRCYSLVEKVSLAYCKVTGLNPASVTFGI
jgi:hypothetical protein